MIDMHCIVHGVAYWSGISLRRILGLTWHMFTHVKTKKSVLPRWYFYFRVVISLSCPIQCYFVALHDYDRYALWLVASPSFASLPPAPSRILLVLPHSLSKPVVPYESPYLPTYFIYLPSLMKTFLYHLKTLFKSFLLVTVQVHGAVRGNRYLLWQKYLTEVLTSQEKVALPPYLMMEWNGSNAANDRWNEKQTPSILEAKIKGTIDHQMIDGVRNKSVSKNKNKRYSWHGRYWEIFTVHRWLESCTLKKKFISVLKLRALVHV